MFNKLLSNLPFNPSLIDQVAFYHRRLRAEASIRRIGFVFVALAFIVQMFAFMSPPQPTLARSGNDLIEGGFGSVSDATFHCRNNTAGYGDILNYYGITCDNVAGSQTVTLNSQDYGGQLFSMGRIAYGKAGETPVNINGNNYWLRYLWSWDGYSSSNYTALRGTSSNGMTFFILYDCGNLVFVGLPPAPRPKPVCLNWYQGWGFWYQSPDGDVNHTTAKTTTDPCKKIVPCPTNPAVPISDAACKPCEAAQTRDDKTACLEFGKTARNDTQNIADANGTTAHAGDEITYILSVKNTGKEDIDNFVVQENISDVLDYARVTDLNGATLGKNHILSWPPVKVASGQTIERVFRVTVKSPIPQTPASSSDPGHFDLEMTNVYGNSVTIKLPGTLSKKTEKAASTLPNTGPGAGLVAGFVLFAFVGYFYARTRVATRELSIVKEDYSTGTGI